MLLKYHKLPFNTIYYHSIPLKLPIYNTHNNYITIRSDRLRASGHPAGGSAAEIRCVERCGCGLQGPALTSTAGLGRLADLSMDVFSLSFQWKT